MTRQKVIDYHTNRLKDKRAEVRLDAIQELLQLDAFEALETLQALYEHDIDAEVRKAAQAVGRTLFLKKRQQDN
jgi:hypothetical protein